MRIALLAHAPARGGSTDLFIQARDFFRGRGHAVECFFGHADPSPDPRTSDACVLPPLQGEDWRSLLKDYAEKVNASNPDLVYAISGRTEADVFRFLPHPRVRHISSLEEHEFFNVPFTLKKYRRFTEACTANTPDTLEQVRQVTGGPVFLLPYLFPEPLHRITEIDSTRLMDPKNPVEIAFVSRIECFQKRAHWLPAIIQQCEDRGAHFHWHFYGDGPYAATLKKRLGHNPRVFFHGWINRETLYEKLPRHDVFFLCSRWEGLPIAMVEAMRCGLACVSTDIPAGIRWTLGQGGGFLYHARAPRQAAEALLHATRDRAVLLEKRREALHLAGKLFSADLARQQFLDLEKSLQQLRFNGNHLNIDHAHKFRAVSVPTYIRRVIARTQRS